MIRPFKINISNKIIEDITKKVVEYPWHEMPDDGGWVYGTNLDYMKEISKYWVDKFDWKSVEEKINKFQNFKSNIDGIDIHFIQEKGSGSNPKPLLLSHGWPGSIVEFLNLFIFFSIVFQSNLSTQYFEISFMYSMFVPYAHPPSSGISCQGYSETFLLIFSIILLEIFILNGVIIKIYFSIFIIILHEKDN